MTLRTSLILLSLAASAAACVSGRHSNKKGTLYIKDVRTSKPPGEDLLKYHHRDVDVFRVASGKGSGYRVYYYRNIADTLRCYQAQFADTADMDRGTYRWENDSLVSIRLYSTVTAYELKFKVFGNTRDGKKISGIITDRQEH